MKYHPKKIISIILLLTFTPFAIWSIMTKRLALFFVVAIIIYFVQRGMNKIWPNAENKYNKIKTETQQKQKNKNTKNKTKIQRQQTTKTRIKNKKSKKTKKAK